MAGLPGSDSASTAEFEATEEHRKLGPIKHDSIRSWRNQWQLEAPAGKTPSSVEVRDIARRTALRLRRAFQKRGRHDPWEDEHAFVDSGEVDPFSLEEPGLYACYEAAASGVAVSAERAGQPVLRLLAGSGRAQSEHPPTGATDPSSSGCAAT